MSTDSERDPSTGRLLRAALRPRETAAGDACLDAETLAAWADGELYGQDAVGIETHLADCARCQAMMAALAKSEPAATSVAPAATRAPIPFQPRQSLRWFVPVAAGTIAATLLVWTAWPRPKATPAAESTMARADTPASAPEVVSPPPPGSTPMMNTPVAAPKPKPAPVLAAAPAPPGTAQALPPPVPVQVQQPRPVAGVVAGGSPLPAPPVSSTAAAAAVRLGAANAKAASDLVRKDTATLSLAIEAMEVTFSSPPPQTLVPAQAAGGGGGGRGGGGVRAIAQTAARQVRWLVAASGRVLRSAAGDTTWEPVAIDPAVTITGGVAPSASVCWLIGHAGAVMLSNDGFTFTRVKFPEPADLRSITAIDARQATVTAVDGKVFTTTDGGVTWIEKVEAGVRFSGRFGGRSRLRERDPSPTCANLPEKRTPASTFLQDSLIRAF